MQSIFISHSTANAWIIAGLIGLIKDVNPETSVFCSSESSIQPGVNYKKAIYENLKNADVFIAIISKEYWRSKYCIMELGAAYERHCFDSNNPVSIQPILVPPLDKGLALANTPLVEMQLTDLTDSAAITLLLKRIADPSMSSRVDELQVRIAEYAAFVHKSILSTSSLIQDAETGVYYDEPAGNMIPKDSIVRCLRTDSEKYLFEFKLSRLGYTPSFASLALQFWDPVNLRDYLLFDYEAEFAFDIENVDGVLRDITVEFKYGPSHAIFQAITKELVPGHNRVGIPLAPMNHAPLGEINQICFVIHPSTMNAPDGEVHIDDISVNFEEKNLLA